LDLVQAGGSCESNIFSCAAGLVCTSNFHSCTRIDYVSAGSSCGEVQRCDEGLCVGASDNFAGKCPGILPDGVIGSVVGGACDDFAVRVNSGFATACSLAGPLACPPN
jgi:hypothetical protein